MKNIDKDADESCKIWKNRIHQFGFHSISKKTSMVEDNDPSKESSPKSDVEQEMQKYLLKNILQLTL